MPKDLISFYLTRILQSSYRVMQSQGERDTIHARCGLRPFTVIAGRMTRVTRCDFHQRQHQNMVGLSVCGRVYRNVA